MEYGIRNMEYGIWNIHWNTIEQYFTMVLFAILENSSVRSESVEQK